MNFHQRIMNVPFPYGDDTAGSAYKLGHRDARHSSAEIANEADILISELQEALERIEIIAKDHGSALEIRSLAIAALAKATGASA